MLGKIFVALSLSVPLALLASGTAGCTSSSDAEEVSDSDLAASRVEPLSFSLPGVSETVLVSDDAGQLLLLSVGERSTKRAVKGAPASRVVAGRSFDGKLWTLAESGKLAAIDPATAKVTATVDTRVRDAADLVIASRDVAFVSSSADGRLVKIDPTTGVEIAKLDLASAALPGAGAGSVTLRDMLLVGGRLVVQIRRATAQGRAGRGALALVDAATLRLDGVVELTAADPRDPARALDGLEPGGPMMHDEAHGKVFVTARGVRPMNTGMLLRLDLAAGKLDPWVAPAEAGFQGPLALGAPGEARKMYIAYHTSTPVSSTHLFEFDLDANGNPVDVEGGAMVDVFEEVPAFAPSASRGLFAFGVSCPAGFCLGGAGVSFVSTETATVHPRLPKADLGIAPSFLLFL